MYKFKSKQISIMDYNTPVGMKLSSNNRWVKKAEIIPWDEIEELHITGNGKKPRTYRTPRKTEYIMRRNILSHGQILFGQELCGLYMSVLEKKNTEGLWRKTNVRSMKISGIWISCIMMLDLCGFSGGLIIAGDIGANFYRG